MSFAMAFREIGDWSRATFLNIDVTPILDGWHGDTSRMFFVGEKISVKARRLVDVTYEAMMRGIAAIRPGLHLGAIGNAIQRYAESQRFSVVRDFCGHGVGRIFHDAPSVLHYGNPEDGPVMREGMIFTVEPMINAGRWEVKILSDGWTAVTKDRSLSAQFEHTVGRDRDRLRDLHDVARRFAPPSLCVRRSIADGCGESPDGHRQHAIGRAAVSILS